MANTVYTTHEYLLDDGETVVILKPLVLSRMRKFMQIIEEELPKSENVWDMQDKLFDAAVICLEKHNPEVVKDLDTLKDNIDLETLYKILDVCGGVKLNDPNLITALAAQENAGAN